MSSSENPDLSRMADIEMCEGKPTRNTTVDALAWADITVTVPDRRSRSPKNILSQTAGIVKAGEMLAVMGPSGSGKSTLLNLLAGRPAAAVAKTTGSINVNQEIHEAGRLSNMQNISAYVEQVEALCGALTVNETLQFAARLSGRQTSCVELLSALGLTQQSSDLIGTPIRKGISGGQKRRVSIAEQLVTNPNVLFLDEPTSGLDSTSSREVMRYVRKVTNERNLIVVCAIHQPAMSVYSMFDRLLLLDRGSTVYSGKVDDVLVHFAKYGHDIPPQVNVAEAFLDLINQDFDHSSVPIEPLAGAWTGSAFHTKLIDEITDSLADSQLSSVLKSVAERRPTMWETVAILMHRSFVKSYRDVVAYGIRVAMYIGLAIMMGTVWLRLSPDQDNIQAFINAIFFGGAFLSFMAIAYIPAFLEDRALYIKEHAHGLYGPTPFLLANFITGVPYLFLIALLFSLIVYWLTNFRSTPEAFITWVMWLFLDLLAAESLVVLISSVMPMFVVALAGTAFANGLWMCTGGFLVPTKTLNAFWRYAFHYVDYQSYVFQGMMVNEFRDRNFTCGTSASGECSCAYDTELRGRCMIAGTGVLSSYGYEMDRMGQWVGCLVAIVCGYRLVTWIILYNQRS